MAQAGVTPLAKYKLVFLGVGHTRRSHLSQKNPRFPPHTSSIPNVLFYFQSSSLLLPPPALFSFEAGRESLHERSVQKNLHKMLSVYASFPPVNTPLVPTTPHPPHQL